MKDGIASLIVITAAVIGVLLAIPTYRMHEIEACNQDWRFIQITKLETFKGPHITYALQQRPPMGFEWVTRVQGEDREELQALCDILGLGDFR